MGNGAHCLSTCQIAVATRIVVTAAPKAVPITPNAAICPSVMAQIAAIRPTLAAKRPISATMKSFGLKSDLLVFEGAWSPRALGSGLTQTPVESFANTL